MKTNHLLTFLVVVSLANPAQARLVDSSDNTHYTFQGFQVEPLKPDASTWEVLQHEAKVTANKWIALINSKISGDVSTPTVAAAPERQVASEPTAVTPVVIAQVATTSASVEKITPEQKQLKVLVTETKKAVNNVEPIKVVKEGRAAAANIPKTKVGVPVFALKTTETKKDKHGKKQVTMISVKNIPKLDIGVERTISKNDFIPPQMQVEFKKLNRPKVLDTPDMYSQKAIDALTKAKMPIVANAVPPKKGSIELGQIVTSKKIEDVSLNMLPTKPLEDLKPVKVISKDDLQMLAAVILFEKGDKCHLAAGLLSDLANKKPYAEESNFYLGVCAHQMGFHTEAVNRLLDVIKSENQEFTSTAITNVVENLPREYDVRVATAIKNLKNQKLIEDVARDNVNYVFARAAHAQDNFSEAALYAEKVSEKSPLYSEARYLYGVGLYGEKKLKEAEQVLLSLREWMNKHGHSDKNLDAQIAVNVARMRFIQGRYQAANEEYMKVPKDQPVWVQALIEQGWTQLNIDDPAGAIGNMYSLHSPYFKSVFMPESWVVRTIGYIDICQFGDAYRTLTRLEQQHNAWLSAVNRYAAAKKDPSEYYNTVKNYIRGHSDSDVDGLPHQVIREIARQRGFLNAQNSLNTLEDEIAQYGFIYGLIKKDQSELSVKVARTKARLTKIKADLAKVKAHPELATNVNEWNAQRRNDEALLKSYEYQTQVFEESRKGYLKLKGSGLARIDQDKNKLRNDAGKHLISHLKDIRTRIEQIFEGNEFLRYEIFSGSGENIRYQVAGGSTADSKRIPANVKPQKMMNWEFDGEYWEDEIGSYRSTLKNNCPKNTHSAQQQNEENKTKTAQNF